MAMPVTSHNENIYFCSTERLSAHLERQTSLTPFVQRADSLYARKHLKKKCFAFIPVLRMPTNSDPRCAELPV